jgi:hypothetical protein
MAGGQFGTLIPIVLNFSSKQKNMNTQLSASLIIVMITPEIRREMKKTAIAV